MQYPSKVVENRTGLSAHVIRAWEKRHGAIAPLRSEGNHRLYSEEDVERLCLLRELTESGFPIGRVAKLSRAELLALQQQAAAADPDPAPAFKRNGESADQAADSEAMVGRLLDSVRHLDTAAMEAMLDKASTLLGAQGVLAKVIVPLAHAIGDLWSRGELKVVHEHFATSMIRGFLANSQRPFALSLNAPRIILTTPAGQLHELGAAIAAAAAASQGWQVTYLGANLPAGEIAAAASIKRATAVGLSIVYPPDDYELPGELILLRRLLPAETAIIAGGRAAPAYAAVLDKIGAPCCTDLDTFTGNWNACGYRAQFNGSNQAKIY